MAPEFEDKPVMEVTAYQIPDDTVYLRGYVGDYYKNGSWKTYDSSDFVTAMQEADSSLKEQTAGQQVQNILAYTRAIIPITGIPFTGCSILMRKTPMHTCHTIRWQAIIRMNGSPPGFLWMETVLCSEMAMTFWK